MASSESRTSHGGHRSSGSRRPAKSHKGTPSGQAYIHGNVAQKMEQVPYRQEKGEKKAGQEKHRRVSSQVRRNQQKALRIDLPYLIMLVAASCCTLFICINYLQVQTTMTRRMDRIKTLEKQLDSLKAENDTLQTRINTAVDLDHVYKVATEELGMVYAGKSQVRMYHQTESEFVRQYEDIPTY